jgi:SAM-dependent methyltransferase
VKPSQNHKNRKSHNWLIYDVQDRSLVSVRHLLHGGLYDLGCGESPYKWWLLKYVDHYVGVDWSESFHEIKADIVANLNKPLPIENEVADIVLSLSVLEHLSEPQLMLNEAYRILKKPGLLVLQVPWQWWIHEAPYDFFRYTPHGLSLMLERAGFKDVNIEPQAGFFTMIVMKLNYFSLRFVRGPRILRLVIHGALRICWYMSQTLAPYLDRIDRNWMLETTGYFAVARKT